MSEFRVTFTVKTEEEVDISEVIIDFSKYTMFECGRWTDLSVVEVEK